MNITPKFLPQEIAEQVISATVNCVFDSYNQYSSRIQRQHLCVIILVPKMKVDDSVCIYPHYPIIPHELICKTFGDINIWEHSYSEIARCKAFQLWYDRATGGCENVPHLLFHNDTPFWGGVKREGIVVATSGLEPYFDRMISGMVADGCIAMARHWWETSPEKKEDKEFLP